MQISSIKGLISFKKRTENRIQTTHENSEKLILKNQKTRFVFYRNNLLLI